MAFFQGTNSRVSLEVGRLSWLTGLNAEWTREDYAMNWNGWYPQTHNAGITVLPVLFPFGSFDNGNYVQLMVNKPEIIWAELINEPEWGGSGYSAGAATYARDARTMAQNIRAVRPNAKLLWTAENANSTNDAGGNWNRDMVNAVGAADINTWCDGFSVHPYSPGSPSIKAGGGPPYPFTFDRIDYMRNFFLSVGINKPFWVTEVGWSEFTTGLSGDQIATFYQQLFTEMNARPWCTAMFTYQLFSYFNPGAAVPKEQAFGHINASTGQDRPCAAVIRSAYVGQGGGGPTPATLLMNAGAPRLTGTLTVQTKLGPLPLQAGVGKLTASSLVITSGTGIATLGMIAGACSATGATLGLSAGTSSTTGPTTSVLDSFTRADATLNTGNWGYLNGLNDRPLSILSNTVGETVAGTAGSYWSASTFGPDSEAFMTMTTNGIWDLFVRLANPLLSSVTGYSLTYNGANNLAFWKIATPQVSLKSITHTAVAGSSYCLQVTGSLLTALVKTAGGTWTTLMTLTDTTFSAAGYIGLETESSAARMDDFGGGTVVPVSSSTYRTLVLGTAGLQAYWRLGEASGSVAADESIGNNGVYVGGVTLGVTGAVTGDSNKAVTLGGGSYMSTPDAPNLEALTTLFSLEAWIKRTAAQSVPQMIMSKCITGFQLGLNSANQIELKQQGGRPLAQSNVTITDTQWHHIVATYSRTSATVYDFHLYLDGVDVTGLALNLGGISNNVASAQDLLVGADWVDGPVTAALDNFTRPNAASLGGNWTQLTGAPQRLRLAAGQASSAGSGAGASGDYWTSTFNSDQEVFVTLGTTGDPLQGASTEVAQGKTAVASSSENNALYPASAGNDGNLSTRWSSAFADDQVWVVDLGSVQTLTQVSINWEAAYAATYEIQTSLDNVADTVVATVTISGAGVEATQFAPIDAKFVRIHCLTRATLFGFSFFECQVFAQSQAQKDYAAVWLRGVPASPGPTGVRVKWERTSEGPTSTLRLGCALNSTYTDQHISTWAANFDSFTCETGMNWADVEPSQGVFDFSVADTLINRARAQSPGSRIRGHSLLDHRAVPAWVTALAGDARAMQAAIVAHVKAVATHYAGIVDCWDVVSEPFNTDGTYRNSVFFQALGPEYIRVAFAALRDADPNADRFINEAAGSIGSTAMRTALATLIRDSLVAGASIGLECHYDSADWPTAAQWPAIVTAFMDAGAPSVEITELDVNGGSITGWNAVAQGALAGGVARVTVWGLRDSDSYRGGGATALAFNDDFTPKAAYSELAAVRGAAVATNPTFTIRQEAMNANGPTGGISSVSGIPNRPGDTWQVQAVGDRVWLARRRPGASFFTSVGGTNGMPQQAGFIGLEAFSDNWTFDDFGGGNVGASKLTMNKGNFFPGSLDEVALYNTALTVTQVQQHAGRGTGGIAALALDPGAAALTTTLALSAKPPVVLQPSDNAVTATLTLQAGGQVALGAGAATATPTLSLTVPARLSLSTAPALSGRLEIVTGAYAALVMRDGALAYWRVDEPSGTTAFDSAGVHPGSYSGATLGVAGLLATTTDTAVSLAGTGGVAIAPDLGLNVGDVVTYEAIIKRSRVGTQEWLMQKGPGTLGVRLDATNHVVASKIGTGDMATSTTTISDTTSAHHVCVTKNGATLRIYIDGVNVTGAVTNQTLVDNTYALTLGD